MNVARDRLPDFFGSVLKLKKVSIKHDPLRVHKRYRLSVQPEFDCHPILGPTTLYEGGLV